MARGTSRFRLRGSRQKKTATSKDSKWKKHFEEFQTVLSRKGLTMKDVEGDGNCMFRAIADQLEGNENLHEKYRILALD